MGVGPGQSSLRWEAGEAGRERLRMPGRVPARAGVRFSDPQAVVTETGVLEQAPRSPGNLLHPSMPTPPEAEKQVGCLHPGLRPLGGGGAKGMTRSSETHGHLGGHKGHSPGRERGVQWAVGAGKRVVTMGSAWRLRQPCLPPANRARGGGPAPLDVQS